MLPLRPEASSVWTSRLISRRDGIYTPWISLQGGPIATSFAVIEDEVFSSGGEAVQPEPVSWFDENFNMDTNYFEGTVVFTVPVRIAESALPGDYELRLQVEFMLCNDSTCLPPQKNDLAVFVTVSEGEGKAEDDWAPVASGEDTGRLNPPWKNCLQVPLPISGWP